MLKKLMILFFILPLLLFPQGKNDPLFTEVEITLNTAIAQSADILCPANFQSANANYQNALELEASNGNVAEIRMELETAVSYLTQMNDKIEVRRNFFSDGIQARRDAIDAGASQYAEYFFNQGNSLLKKSVANYLDDDIDDSIKLLSEAVINYKHAKDYSQKAANLIRNWQPLSEADKSLAMLLAPKTYAEGMANFATALDILNTGGSIETADEIIAKAEIYFSSSKNIADNFASDYANVLNSRDAAKIENASTFAIDYWQDAEMTLKNSGSSYENKNFESASESAALADNKYKTAKSEAVKNQILNDARLELAAAKQSGAEDFAPKSFALASGLLIITEELVESGNYSRSNAEQFAYESFIEANKAKSISLMAKKLSKSNLSWEDFFLSWSVPKYISTYNSRTVVKNDVQTIYDEPAPANDKPAEIKTEPEPVRAKPANIFQIFTSDDTEINDSQNQVFVRIFNIKYSPMSAELTSHSVKSVEDIIKAIELYPNSNAEITVFTDNVGIKSVNEELSLKRAEKIKDYISSHSNISEDHITAIGKGESDPIADNKSFEGREKNRRVELLIKK